MRVAAAAALAFALALAGAASGASTSTPVYRNCGKRVIRPRSIIVTCADAGYQLRSLKWKSWGGRTAVATGLAWVNDCKPYCAAGRFHSYRVLVRLDHPQPWKKHPQRQHYTRMVLVFPDGRPDGYDRVVSYPLWT